MILKRRMVAVPGAALLLLAAALFSGAALRLASLAGRPMHADEAVLADKLGSLIEKGEYRYDPRGYHGPALLYFSRIPVRLAGVKSYSDLTESLLRITPALSGLLLALVPPLLAPALGWGAAAWASLFLAVSPAFVYYSRYFIPETLLVLFTAALIACGYRWLTSGRLGWALAAGLSGGLMLATKETAVIVLAVVGLACAPWARRASIVSGKQAAAAACLGAAAAAALLSSLGDNPEGILDFLRSYSGTYLERGLEPGPHAHPWCFYWELLGWFHQEGGPVFTEAAILLPAAVGAWAGWRKGARFLRFLVLYAAGMAAVYSLIPYKTPWCVLSFYFAMVLLAGVGGQWLLETFEKNWRAAVWVLLAAAAGFLVWQSVMASFRYGADPRNPWVYAHTSRDVYLLRDRLAAVAAAHPAGRAMPLQVVSQTNLWPLPWYFRFYSRVEWWTGVPEKRAPAPVILITPEMEPGLVSLLYESRPPGQRELYMTMFSEPLYLRPGVEIRGYAAKSLWDRYLAAGPPPSR